MLISVQNYFYVTADALIYHTSRLFEEFAQCNQAYSKRKNPFTYVDGELIRRETRLANGDLRALLYTEKQGD